MKTERIRATLAPVYLLVGRPNLRMLITTKIHVIRAEVDSDQ
jgi:hypothetical protein